MIDFNAGKAVMKKQEYFVHYDIESKTQTIIENDIVMREHKFEFCPYVWFGELKEKIEAGLISYVIRLAKD